MAARINRAIELLAQDQAIYYVGHHTGHLLTHAQGRQDAHTWADYINVGMEHGSFDMAGLAEYMRGLVDASHGIAAVAAANDGDAMRVAPALSKALNEVAVPLD